MKTVYLVRHGETLANIDGTWQGPADQLSPRGFVQADKLAERLKETKFDVAVCSLYKRAQQTAEVLSKELAISFIPSALFTEVKNPSSVIGVKHEKVPGNAVAEYLAARDSAEDRDNFRYEDEETFTELITRARAALHFLSEQTGDSLLVVTHGTLVRTLTSVILSQHELRRSPSEIFYAGRYMKTTNTGITVVTYDETAGTWALVTFNDYSHFAE